MTEHLELAILAPQELNDVLPVHLRAQSADAHMPISNSGVFVGIYVYTANCAFTSGCDKHIPFLQVRTGRLLAGFLGVRSIVRV